LKKKDAEWFKELIHQIQSDDVDIETVEYDFENDSAVFPSAGTAYTTTLKRECPTRWNSLLTMLESLLKSRQLVERCLASLRQFDKIPSLDDWTTIEDVVNFLMAFKKATELLSGSEYPTSSITLLFRAELASTLQIQTVR